MRLVLTILLIGWLAETPCAGPSQTSSYVFHSSTGFSVDYPSTWIRISQSTTELDILSTPKPTHGAVIPRKQAEIILGELIAPAKPTFRQFLENEYHVRTLSSSRILRPARRGRACNDVERVTAIFEMAPNVVQRDIFFLCVLRHRNLVLSLTYWDGDRVNPKWERTAMRILENVRFRSK